MVKFELPAITSKDALCAWCDREIAIGQPVGLILSEPYYSLTGVQFGPADTVYPLLVCHLRCAQLQEETRYGA